MVLDQINLVGRSPTGGGLSGLETALDVWLADRTALGVNEASARDLGVQGVVEKSETALKGGPPLPLPCP